MPSVVLRSVQGLVRCHRLSQDCTLNGRRTQAGNSRFVLCVVTNRGLRAAKVHKQLIKHARWNPIDYTHAGILQSNPFLFYTLQKVGTITLLDKVSRESCFRAGLSARGSSSVVSDRDAFLQKLQFPPSWCCTQTSLFQRFAHSLSNPPLQIEKFSVKACHSAFDIFIPLRLQPRTGRCTFLCTTTVDYIENIFIFFVERFR